MKTCVRTGVPVAFLILLTALLPLRLRAQQNTATLSGAVLDASGAGVRNASVVATNEASNQVSKVTTDAQGHFSVPSLTPGRYTLEVSAPGFAADTRSGLEVTPDKNAELAISLKIGSVSEVVTVEANDSDSVAAHLAPMDSLLDERSARTEIKSVFIQNFTSPNADFGELVEMAPGTFSIYTNGVGLGQDKTYFRGFPDGDYDIDFDGVPFYDTNTPTHHSWAFFPSPWVGGVDFDRSPGTASTIGPTPFGGSIHLLSPELKNDPIITFGVTYGSFNTKLFDGSFDSGKFGPGRKSNLFADVQHMTSNGYQTYNNQIRNGGSLKYQYKFSDTNVLTGFSGVIWLDSNTPNGTPTRAQLATFGDNFLLVNDQNTAELTASNTCNLDGRLYPLNYHFNFYHIPTDFEYVGWTKQWGKGWQTDFRPYTLSYYNAQYYNNVKFASDGLTFSGTPVSATSAVDKLNSYRKYGENFVVSQVSKVGIFRAGLWYEWATTNRYQIPSNPVNLIDAALPNFHENFYTSTYQPFAEYEYHVTQRLTVTGGFKYWLFQSESHAVPGQRQGRGMSRRQAHRKRCGTDVRRWWGIGQSQRGLQRLHAFGRCELPHSLELVGVWTVRHRNRCSPSGVFDVAGANVAILPKPTSVYTFQGGTVYKVKQLSINADYYYTHYQNAYSSINDPQNTNEFDQVAQGDAVSRGFEGELNFYLCGV